MTWYRTGTVSVTNGNTTITGAGTQFVANVSIGEGIILPDGRIYEIADVVSNTSLIIGTPYLGGQSSGQSYAIAPLRGRIATLLAETSSLIASFADVRDGPGAGIFPNGTAASPSVRFQGSQSTGFFRPSNNQIAAAINGNQRWLITNTSMQFDGSEIYRRANILGTVSQSGGTPTGAIIQRGSNANGEFIRYADGTQICWGTRSVPEVVGSPELYNYPAAFSALPTFTFAPANGQFTGTGTTNRIRIHACGGWSGQTTTQYRGNMLSLYANPDSARGYTDTNLQDDIDAEIAASRTVAVSWTAIGRWF